MKTRRSRLLFAVFFATSAAVGIAIGAQDYRWLVLILIVELGAVLLAL
jgi:hypothetical protein